MAASNLVLRGGVGPTSTIGLFVTHGLLPGAFVPPVILSLPVGGSGDDSKRRKEYLAYKERLRKQRKLRKRYDRVKDSNDPQIAEAIAPFFIGVADTLPSFTSVDIDALLDSPGHLLRFRQAIEFRITEDKRVKLLNRQEDDIRIKSELKKIEDDDNLLMMIAGLL